MAERLKRRWFKFMAVFCSLYLAPLSNLFTKVFAFIKPADALAVTAYCYPDSSTWESPEEYLDRADVIECGGSYAENNGHIDGTGNVTWYYSSGQTTTPLLTCTCKSDGSKVTTYHCLPHSQYSEYGQWVEVDSCVSPETSVTCATGEIAVAGKCYPTCIEDPANGIGYVANEPAF